MARKVFGTGMLVTALAFGMLVAGCDLLADDDQYTRIVTGVVATPLDRDSIHVTWNRASGATHFELAYRTSMDSVDTRIPISSRLTDTTFTHTGFIRNRGPLTYYVRAHGVETDSDGVRTQWVGPWAMSPPVDDAEFRE